MNNLYTPFHILEQSIWKKYIALFSQAFNFRLYSSYHFFTLVRQKKYIWETCDFFGRKAPTEDYRIPTEPATINVFFGQWKPKTFTGKLRRGAGHYSTDLSGGLLLRKMPLEASKRTVLDKSPPIIDIAKAGNLIGKKAAEIQFSTLERRVF